MLENIKYLLHFLCLFWLLILGSLVAVGLLCAGVMVLDYLFNFPEIAAPKGPYKFTI